MEDFDDTFGVRIIGGTLRSLTSTEKMLYPQYKYVTTSEFSYRKGEFYVEVPRGFLTDGSSGGPDYGNSWIFHDYLYATHCFTSGQSCTRQQADSVMEAVLRNERLNIYCWGFVKLAKLNPFWLFSRAWKSSGRRGPQTVDYESKKDL